MVSHVELHPADLGCLSWAPACRWNTAESSPATTHVNPTPYPRVPRMRTPHDPRPTRPRARRALPPGWLASGAWALAPLLLASCTDNLTANCPPLAHPPILTVAAAAAASNPCAAKAGEAALQ